MHARVVEPSARLVSSFDGGVPRCGRACSHQKSPCLNSEHDLVLGFGGRGGRSAPRSSTGGLGSPGTPTCSVSDVFTAPSASPCPARGPPCPGLVRTGPGSPEAGPGRGTVGVQTLNGPASSRTRRRQCRSSGCAAIQPVDLQDSPRVPLYTNPELGLSRRLTRREYVWPRWEHPRV